MQAVVTTITSDADDYAKGARQWTAPWGNHGGNDFINMFPHRQYCRKYGGKESAYMLFYVARGYVKPSYFLDGKFFIFLIHFYFFSFS